VVSKSATEVGGSRDGNAGDRDGLDGLLDSDSDSTSESSPEGNATSETLGSLMAADLRVYCIGPNEPLPLPLAVHAGGEGGGDGREEDARARLED
jgi:hypothetical protein